jgi:threonine aldolase
MNRGFGSDNHSGVHPEIFSALLAANVQHAPSYGTDLWSERAEKVFQNYFGREARVFYVFNGTSSNALALTAMAKSFESVLCSDSSHISVDECGAPEFFFRGKLISIPCKDGKLTVNDLEPHLIRGGDQHFSQPRVLSLTQPTELGTVYSLAELKTLCSWAKSKRLFIHMDGTRISNAALHLGLSFREFTTDLGVDVVSFGGTKNGLLFGEALVFLNPSLAENFKFIRKQCGQLPSKSRFLAASFERYLSDNLWLEIARHQCTMADRLCQGLKEFPKIHITRPRESNAVFAEIPQPVIKKLREDFFFYVWNEKTFECRLMTSWDTTTSDIDGFLQKLRSSL